MKEAKADENAVPELPLADGGDRFVAVVQHVPQLVGAVDARRLQTERLRHEGDRSVDCRLRFCQQGVGTGADKNIIKLS